MITTPRSRVVDRRFVYGDKEKERLLLRMYERFSGCHILSYCLMSNHLHVLLEVPPGCEKGEGLGLSDEELLYRLGGLHSRNHAAAVGRDLEEARSFMEGRCPGWEELTSHEKKKTRSEGEKRHREIHARYGYRMHSLSEFFKGMLQRFTCWFNRENGRRGTLWESRFRSVIVQDGLAARSMAAYIDLNPVRAGLVDDPADYRWSSYGEAVGGGKGAKKARLGLVRALYAFGKKEVTARSWSQGGVGKEYRRILIQEGMEQGEAPRHSNSNEKVQKVVTRKGMNRQKAAKELERLSKADERDLKISKVVRCRIRYFTDGAVIGSKDFVNGIFESYRDRFGPKRNSGARKPRGELKTMADVIWSLRDLKEEVP